MELDQDERAHLEWSRALSTDNEGREVYAGLSFAESQEFHSLRCNAGLSPSEFGGTLEDYRRRTQRHIQLFEKHEAARLQVLLAVELSSDIPPRH